MYKMKPCPFCGGSAFTVKEIYPNGRTYWHVLHWNSEKCFIDDCKVTDYHKYCGMCGARMMKEDNDEH